VPQAIVDAVRAPGASTVDLPITVAVQAAGVGSSPLFLMSTLPPLALLPRAQWSALPEDELVARRAAELDAGDALDTIRAAVAGDDWQRAQILLHDAEARFADNDWTRTLLQAMRRLIAKRDARMSMKEAAYQKWAMSRRLAMPGESKFLSPDSDAAGPAYVRRRSEQGKGRPT